jgi:hypothetical protein
LFGDLDNAIRRKRNASLRHHSGVTIWKRSKTTEWIKQKTKKSQEILIKEAKKQGRTLRKEEKSKDKTARSRRQEIKLTIDDIDRSHIIGNITNGKGQIICRLRNWKIKNKIYSNQSSLKNNPDKIVITEDLTRHRQYLVIQPRLMRSSISCSILIIVFEDDSVFLVNILPSLVQKEFIGRLFLAWFRFCTKYWRWRVRSSVITILSGLFFRLLWLLYILFFIFQFLKRHIIFPFPLVIFPIICDIN